MSKCTVMVVEDEPMLMSAIKTKLELSGYSVIPFLTGSEAIDYAQKDNQLPAIIWLDYYLKDTNGLEVMNKLKKNSRWQEIPFIIVSNSASEDKKQSLLALGAKKYLVKAENRLDDIIKELEEIIAQCKN